MKRLLWAIPLLLVLGLWASSSPDGLQWMAARLGIAQETAPAFNQGRLGKFLAGLLGCLLVYALALGLQRLAGRRRSTSTPPAAPPRR